ncbi:MAG: DUF3168 domain-containing protein [Phyllobacteriaceae bacterium]|nr:DUF3168 domain-containing protein [Phyllobacteriaceae bacterium]
MSASRSLVAAVLAALRGDAALVAVLADRLWDGAPRDPGFPHLVVDEAVARDRSGLDAELEEVRLTLKIFSRAGGTAEAGRLAERVETVLAAAALAPVGVRVVLLRREASETRLARDRRTAEATLRLVALTEPA